MNSSIENTPISQMEHIILVWKNLEWALQAQQSNSLHTLTEASEMIEWEIQCASFVHRNPVACETFFKNFLPIDTNV